MITLWATFTSNGGYFSFQHLVTLVHDIYSVMSWLKWLIAIHFNCLFNQIIPWKPVSIHGPVFKFEPSILES